MLHHLLPRNEAHSVSAEIHLQHDLIIVQPPGNSSEARATDRPSDTLLSGVVIIASHPGIVLWTIRIAFVVQYRFRLPGTYQWQEGIIHEHAKTFSHGGGMIGPTYNRNQDLIRRQLDFAILIPRDAPTYEDLPHAKIVPQIKVDVEFGHCTPSPSAIAALPPAPPLYKGEKNEGETIAGRNFRTKTWSGTVHKPSLSTHTKPVCTNTSPFTGCPFRHLKQTWIKEFAIASVSASNGRPKTLRFTREGLSSGIGAWKLYLWSDSFSVGSYIVPRLEFRNISPACNIYSIQIVISQQYSCKPLEQFFTEQESAAEHQYPFESHLIHTEGHRPLDLPEKAEPTLFTGRSNRSAATSHGKEPPSTGDEFTWEPGKVRLPDDATIRPSTSVGTRTPVNISHKITIKVMFSVTGQTVDNKPLPSPNSKGQLRMLLIDIYEHLPSCTCVREWISLPGYEEANKSTDSSGVPFCACCYTLQDFPVASFSQAFPREERPLLTRLWDSESSMASDVSSLSTVCKTPAMYATRL